MIKKRYAVTYLFTDGTEQIWGNVNTLKEAKDFRQSSIKSRYIDVIGCRIYEVVYKLLPIPKKKSAAKAAKKR